MRVMQAMAGAEVGGAEAFFARLVPALADAGLEQRAVIRRHEVREAILNLAGVATTAVRFGGPLDLVSRRAFARAIRAFEPDIVLTWSNRATSQCPRGRFVHLARLGGFYNLKYYRRCDHLIGNTEGIRRYLVDQGWPEERAHYLPNFVDAEAMPSVDRALFDTPADAKLVLALGRLHPNKAFDVLIEAMAEVPDAYLWIAGSGPLERYLKQHAATLGLAGRTRFLGWRDDTAALLAAADVMVCPSRHEPLGNVVLEGWAHRRPVVAAASQGPSELIEDRVTGLLVPVDQAAPLAAAIRACLSDGKLAAELAEAGHAAYQARFTREAVVRAYLDFFDRVRA
jgi:glycosyltransferase involved in cell wall biosynthesis